MDLQHNIYDGLYHKCIGNDHPQIRDGSHELVKIYCGMKWLLLPGHYRVTGEALLAEST